MPPGTESPADPWLRHVMAIERVTERMERIVGALESASVPYALIGGQAVAVWVGSRDPAATRTTKDVDILLRKEDLPAARAAALAAGFDYCEIIGVGMFLEREDPNPRQATHLVWAGEKVRPEHPVSAPTLDESERLGDRQVVSLPALVRMKLAAWRDQDRVHLRDLIDVGLIDRSLLPALHPELAARLDPLLTEMGR